MPSGLSITQGTGKTRIRVFPCPVCKETINTWAQQCPFCSSPVDQRAAQASADETARVNEAVSDASYVKVAGVMLLVCFGLCFVPFISLFAWIGCIILTVVVAAMAIRWWVVFWSFKPNDRDFRTAKTAVLTVGIAPLALILLGMLIVGAAAIAR